MKNKKILSIKVTDEHVHDGKALPELVDNLTKSNSITTTIGELFADDGAPMMATRFLDAWRTMESCLVLK